MYISLCSASCHWALEKVRESVASFFPVCNSKPALIATAYY